MEMRLPWLDLFGKSVGVTRFGEYQWRAYAYSTKAKKDQCPALRGDSL
jgi:hypothetical protein